jgi:outer membrane protein assembly factor BamB
VGRRQLVVLVGLFLVISLSAGTILVWPAQPSLAVGVGSWTQFGHDAQRTGRDPLEQSPFSSVVHDWDASVVGNVYSQPLVYNGRVYVATEENYVYAFDGTTGNVVWTTQVGATAPASVVPLGCSNSNPNIGITSTPVIDTERNRIYVVAQKNNPLRYEFMGLDLATGAVVPSLTQVLDPWPGATQADKAAQDALQDQRAALLLANEYVYVAWGGRAECAGHAASPNYQGWVVAVPLAGQAGGTRAFHAPLPTGNGAGVWSPAGPVADTAGNIYVPTGNVFESAGQTNPTADLGQSVVKLAPDLTLEDHWTASNWYALTLNDYDVGSASPEFVGNGLIFQAGKDGRGFLLNDGNLGGGKTIPRTGGEIFTQSQRLCAHDASTTAYHSYGVPTWLSPMLFLPCTDGIKGVRVTTSGSVGFTKAWDGPIVSYPSSPILAGGAVWYVDEPSRTLSALNPTDGTSRFAPITLPGNPEAHFANASSGNGRIYAPSNAHLSAYRLVASTNPTPTPTATPVGTATTVTLNPVADTYTARSDPDSTAGGTSTFLRADIQHTDTAFLRFDLTALAGKSIARAFLRVHTTALSWAGSLVTFNIRRVTSNTWSEATMSYNNTVPTSAIVPTPIGTLNGPASDAWYNSSDLNLQTIQGQVGGLLSMAIDAPQGDVIIFYSREAGSAGAPQLVLTVQ